MSIWPLSGHCTACWRRVFKLHTSRTVEEGLFLIKTWAPAHSCPLLDRHIWAVICTLEWTPLTQSWVHQGKPPSEPGMDEVGRYAAVVVQLLSRVRLCSPLDCSTPGLPVLHRLPEFCPSSCPLSQWCHPTISSSVIPFSCLQSFPSWRSFPVSGQTPNAATPRGLNLRVQRTTLGNLQTSVKSVETPFPSTAVCGMWASHLISLSLNFSVYKMGL